VLVVRPEALRFGGRDGSDRGLAGVVIARRFAGPWSYFRVKLERGGEVEVLARTGAVEVDQQVTVTLDPAAAPPTLFSAEAG